MSVLLMGMIWKDARRFRGPALIVALALADHAHDDGSHVFPTVTSLAAKTRLSPRAVQKHLRMLERDGFLERVNEADGRKGRGNQYRIVVERVHDVHGCTPCTGESRGDDGCTQRSQRVHGGVSHIDNRQKPSNESSIPRSGRRTQKKGLEQLELVATPSPPIHRSPREEREAFDTFVAAYGPSPDASLVRAWRAWKRSPPPLEAIMESMARYDAWRAKQGVPRFRVGPARFISETWLNFRDGERRPPVAPPEPPDHPAWGRLRESLGGNVFDAYFGGARLNAGPPCEITVGSEFAANEIKKRWPMQLMDALGGIAVDVTARARAENRGSPP